MGDFFGAVVNAGANIATSIYGNEQAREREEEARIENYNLGERAARNADARTRSLYYDLYSPEAQMEQIKAAGLSPSLFYGDAGGVSGQAGAQGTGATGISPNVFGMSPIDFAQIRALNAEADLKQAQAKTESGENERGNAEIKSIIENTNNTMLKNVFQEYENSLEEINVTVEASLQETKIKNYIEQTNYLSHITRSAKVKGDIDEASKNDVINYLHERTQNLAADTLLKIANKELAEANINLTKEQCKDLISQITTREGQLDLNRENLAAQVAQWAVQNGLTQRDLNQKLTQIIWEGANGTIRSLANLIFALKPK